MKISLLSAAKSRSIFILIRSIRKIERHSKPRRNICTSSRQYFLFDKMTSHERILVHFIDSGQTLRKADFIESIFDRFSSSKEELTTDIQLKLQDKKLIITKPRDRHDAIKLKRPGFCPIHNITPVIAEGLPEMTLSRGIDVGAAVILESGDRKILLTRRGDHLHTFPGIWVPPGGHLEANETLPEVPEYAKMQLHMMTLLDVLGKISWLAEAGLRELEEETGLHLTVDMFEGKQITPLAAWESVYPPKLSLGHPKRHHAVVYLHARLNKHITSDSLTPKVKIDPGEVGACAWFDIEKVKAIVSVTEGQDQGLQQNLEKYLDQKISALVLTDKKEQVQSDLPFSDLLKASGDIKDQKGRVSTGTKFALEEWLSATADLS